MNKLVSLSFIVALSLQACGGGGGGSTPPSSVVTPPPSFESPHPGTWETQSPADAGFNAAALSDAFDYAMQDGTFTQAALGHTRRQTHRGAVSRHCGR